MQTGAPPIHPTPSQVLLALAQDTGPKALQGLGGGAGLGCLELAVPSGQLGLHKVVVKAEAAPEEAFWEEPGPGVQISTFKVALSNLQRQDEGLLCVAAGVSQGGGASLVQAPLHPGGGAGSAPRWAQCRTSCPCLGGAAAASWEWRDLCLLGVEGPFVPQLQARSRA